MKRFLIISGSVFVLAAAAIYLMLYHGIYINLRSDATPAYGFCVLGKEIMVRTDSDNWRILQLRGVDITSDMPGWYASDFAPHEEDYLRWFESVSAMGANAIRVYTVMDDDFYNAFYRHNISSAYPLYLIQGVQVSDAANYGPGNAYNEDYMGRLAREGRIAVDVIHGRRFLTAADVSGRGYYRKDISRWVIGYILGYEWNADVLSYTDHSIIHDGLYAGAYFTTLEEASPFESMLAQVMDEIIMYEADKYGAQRLIGFTSSPENDFLEYEQMYARQLGKYSRLDAEHIIPTAALQSGFFIEYRIFDLCADFTEYISQRQAEEIAPLLAQIDIQDAFDGYMDLLSLYHSMPVTVACGASSARGVISERVAEPRTEREQGEYLAEAWMESVQAELSGFFISAWQDNWANRSWNTAFAMDQDNNRLWHDLQSVNQSFGLMAFEPGTSPACIIDGDPSEWDGEPVFTEDGISLYVRTDQSCLYMMLQGDAESLNRNLYVPIDVISGLGSRESAAPELSFERAADFILCVDVPANSRLLVHERYDATRMNFNYEQGGTDPFVDVPTADSTDFKVVSMAVGNDTLVDTSVSLTAQELRRLKALKSHETGRLVYGNGNPASEEYNSLSDIRMGEGCIELRIPWLLLNVADPAEMKVHDDYYTHYGVELAPLRIIWLGLGDNEGVIPLYPFRVSPTGRDAAYRERLKQSYYVMQSHWGGMRERQAAPHGRLF